MDPVTFPGFSALSADDVAQTQNVLAQWLQEAFPALDLRTGGVLMDLNVHVAAAMLTGYRQVVDQLRQGLSLSAVTANPALATDAVVDALLSNYRLVRSPGSAASGLVAVVVDTLLPVVIPAGTAFQANGLTFQTASSFAFRISPETVAGPNDRVLVPLNDGTGRYQATISAQATTPGLQGMLRRGQPLTLAQAIPHVVQAYAAADFSGGQDAQGTADLLNRLASGLAVRAWSNRTSIDAMIRADARFAGVLGLSVIGAGDPELFRASHGLVPAPLPGRCDLYARTAPIPANVTATLPATLVGADASGAGIWQVAVGPAVAPGFYEATRIVPTGDLGTGTLAIAGMTLGFATSGDNPPDITAPAEARYSCFQTATIRFLDPAAPATGLTPGVTGGNYDVTLAYLPSIDTLQSFVGGRSSGPPGGDVVAKAAIPAFVSASLLIHAGANSGTIDTQAIAAAIAAAINQDGFVGELPASRLSCLAQGMLPPGSNVVSTRLWARIPAADGQNRFLSAVSGPNVLRPVDEPAMGISPRTVCFFADPADIVVETRPAPLPEV